MTTLKRLAVYCGSAPGTDPAFAEAARQTGEAMAARGIDLVYGGGKLGLMGIVADTVRDGGGNTYGVIPEALVELEVAHTGLTELHTVAGMHERKAMMADLADGFLVLPGGIGTFDELFEAWSWNALGYHAKPFCLVDVGGFWEKMTDFLDHASACGFLSSARRAQLLVAASPEGAIEKLDEAVRTASQAMVW